MSAEHDVGGRDRRERAVAGCRRMGVAEAQRDMRVGLLGGFMGQFASGLLWLTSAALATWSAPEVAVAFLVVAGFFIFPLTRLGLRLSGHPFRVSPSNPLNGLGMQTAFVLPLALLLVGAASLYRYEWFYPAFMIVLGAHYLPFVTLYGMRMFYALAGTLVGTGVVFALYLPAFFSAGAWFTAVVLLLFAFLGRRTVSAEISRSLASPRSPVKSEKEHRCPSSR